MGEYTLPIILGIVFGVIGRLVMLKTDYRQYPTYPHGGIIHLALGIIAAGLGSIAVPALFEEEYAAITFLALAAQQFRDVRNMERNTLTELDSMEMVSRGKTYIEGIAMAFEGRNYLVIFTSFVTSLTVLLFNWWSGVIVGVLAIAMCAYYKSGKQLVKISDISPAAIRFEGPNLFVEDIHIMNVGVIKTKELIQERGMGFILTPKSMDSVVTLANLGQRQAVLHDLSVGLGIYRDAGNPSLVPLTRRNINDGRVAVFFLPQIQNVEQGVRVISKVPILENAVRIPSESDAKR
ncbi:YIEGIA family protein [Caldalkalibacillus mannanilyticus]|uniref:YIEGIA family protein n=1 Tax=Caldalkalibacillus mannanilyticus TaxID=1418 RepID=UPI00054CEB7A|nr:YIEGIA family protein [Caldalkalibacillus mannanilyticus]